MAVVHLRRDHTTTWWTRTRVHSSSRSAAGPLITLTSSATGRQIVAGSRQLRARRQGVTVERQRSPCAQVDSSETLTMAATASGLTFSSVRLDLEMTGDATAKIEFLPKPLDVNNIYQLVTGPGVDALPPGPSSPPRRPTRSRRGRAAKPVAAPNPQVRAPTVSETTTASGRSILSSTSRRSRSPQSGVEP